MLKSIKTYLSIVIVIFVNSCAKVEKNKIYQVEIATGYCHGECAFTASKIDKSLKMEFFGGKYADKQGNFYGNIKEQTWDNITRSLNKINFLKLKNSYIGTVDDQSIEIIVSYNSGKKVIKAQSESLPYNLKKIIYDIATVYKNVNLQPTKNNLKFTTTIQNTPKLIGKPKFPPVNF